MYERRDGKFVVRSSDDSLTPEAMALGYKQLQRVDGAGRMLKRGIGRRPVFHFAPHGICAHVSLCRFALLLERLAEQACHETWRHIRDDLRPIKLARLLMPPGEVWQATEPREATRKRWRQSGISPLPPILNLEPKPTHAPHPGPAHQVAATGRESGIHGTSGRQTRVALSNA